MTARDGHGFTLIEILVVIALIALLAGILLPNLGGSMGIRLSQASREVASELQYVSQRAITTGRLHRWVVDLDKQRFRVEQLERHEQESEPGLPTHSELLSLAPPGRSEEYVPAPNKTGAWRSLESDTIFIDEVRVGQDGWREGTIPISFGPEGGADPAEIWLLDEAGYERRLRIVGFTGEIRVEEAQRD